MALFDDFLLCKDLLELNDNKDNRKKLWDKITEEISLDALNNFDLNYIEKNFVNFFDKLDYYQYKNLDRVIDMFTDQFLIKKHYWDFDKIEKLSFNLIPKFKIKLEINKRMELLFGEEKWKEFKKLLDVDGGFITGSFIIQCILDEEWDDSDIDIFVAKSEGMTKNMNPLSNINKFFDKHKFKFINYDNLSYGNDINSGNNITFIRNYKIKQKKIQIINTSLDKGELEKFILREFDFDIVKNYYSVDNNQNKLVITNLYQIQARELVWRYYGNFTSSIKRGLRYKKRGFNITDQIDIIQTYKIFLEKYVNIKVGRGRCVNSYYSPEHHFKKYIYETDVDIKKYNKKLIIYLKHNIKDYQKIDTDSVLKDIDSVPKGAYVRGNCCGQFCFFNYFGIIHFHINGRQLADKYYENLVIIQKKNYFLNDY